MSETIETTDTFEDDTHQTSEHLLESIDFKALREQKSFLLKLQNPYTDVKVSIEEQNKAIDGLISLIDAIQDHLVDDLCNDEHEVFGDLEVEGPVSND